MKEIPHEAKLISFPVSPAFILDECWYDSQRALVDESSVSLVDIIPLCFSMLICDLEEEQ
jgi:hypothetical protein